MEYRDCHSCVMYPCDSMIWEECFDSGDFPRWRIWIPNGSPSLGSEEEV